MRPTVLACIAALSGAVPAVAQEGGAMVDEAVIARAVTDRMPADTGSAFPADVGRVYLWTRVSGAAGATLRHVWFHGDEQRADVPLEIGGSPWRTWSSKTIPAEWTGQWRVEIRNAAGAVLKEVRFTVGG